MWKINKKRKLPVAFLSGFLGAGKTGISEPLPVEQTFTFDTGNKLGSLKDVTALDRTWIRTESRRNYMSAYAMCGETYFVKGGNF